MAWVATDDVEAVRAAVTDLGLTGEAVKKAVHRMRQRYYALFREAIAQTVADPAEVADEMRYLCAVMAG